MKRLIATLLSTAACSSCGDQSPDATDWVVRDSAGVTVVESTSPAWADGEGWTVDFSPSLDLSQTGSGPRHEFFRATDGDRLSDGSIIVADDGSDEVRHFSESGQHLATLGRNGSGPGEFGRLDQVTGLPGDSILAYDFWQARVTIFAPDGQLAEVVSLDPGYRPRPLHRIADLGYVGRSTDFTGFRDEVGPRRWRHPIIRVAPDGAVQDTLITILGDESIVFSRGDAQKLWQKQGHLSVHDDQVYVGSADSVEYRILDVDGRVSQIVRVPGYDLTLLDGEKDAEREAVYPDSVLSGPFVREILELHPHQGHRPAFEAMVVDALGNVWLEAYQAVFEAGEPNNWLVFDAGGRWLGRVAFPPRFEVFRIGEDWVLGKRVDDLEVEHVQLLTLNR